jgi:N-acetylglucosamine-6-phosphate deacetylase
VRLGVEAALVGEELVRGDVEVVEGRLTAVGLEGGAKRGIAVPGLVDLQVNGFDGVDFLDADPEGYRHASSALARSGVTAFLPTLVTAPVEHLVAALGVIAQADAPGVLGAHLEGPFISAMRLGAHPASARRDPDAALLKRLLVAGPVRLVTLAPELPGADALIRGLLEREIAVSLGHSNATGEQAHAAFDLGVRSVTHVFNATRPFSHRDPGIVGAALARDDVVVQAIFDGVHLAPETESLIRRAAHGRLALVSDHTPVEGGRLEDGTLAGSTATLLDGVRRLHATGASLEEAVGAATHVPARILGEPTVGRLAPGLPADVIVLSDRLELERVLVGGTDPLD